MDKASIEKMKAVSAQYLRSVRSEPTADHSDFLLQQIEATSDPDERSVIEISLVGEYQRIGRYGDAVAILERNIRADPDHPYPVIALAEHYHYADVNYPTAKKHIAIAVQKARRSGEFLYQALGVQARVAIESEDWILLEETLRELTCYQHEPGKVDVFPESDFLKRIPPGKIDPALVEAYTSRVQYLRSIGYSTLTGRST